MEANVQHQFPKLIIIGCALTSFNNLPRPWSLHNMTYLGLHFPESWNLFRTMYAQEEKNHTNLDTAISVQTRLLFFFHNYRLTS